MILHLNASVCMLLFNYQIFVATTAENSLKIMKQFVSKIHDVICIGGLLKLEN